MVTISIIIPTYNRGNALRRTLTSLRDMDRESSGFEILVIDNGSTDSTKEVVEDANRQTSFSGVRYLFEPVPGLLSGRHRGALEAKGEVLLFLDDDVRVSRSAVSALAEAFGDRSVVLAGGPSRPLFEAKPPEWLTAYFSETEEGRHCCWLSLFDGGGRSKEISPLFVWGLNYAIRRSALFDYGGFHPDCMPKHLQRFQGDGESGLNLKIAAADLKAVYVPEAGVEHEVPAARLTVEYFEQRAFYEGVCDSYSRVRASGTAPPLPSGLKNVGRAMRRLLGTAFHGEGDRSAPQARTDQAYRAGFQFHQSEVARDPALLNWVCRKDYWDYALPDCGVDKSPDAVPFAQSLVT